MTAPPVACTGGASVNYFIYPSSNIRCAPYCILSIKALLSYALHRRQQRLKTALLSSSGILQRNSSSSLKPSPISGDRIRGIPHKLDKADLERFRIRCHPHRRGGQLCIFLMLHCSYLHLCEDHLRIDNFLRCVADTVHSTYPDLLPLLVVLAKGIRTACMSC